MVISELGVERRPKLSDCCQNSIKEKKKHTKDGLILNAIRPYVEIGMVSREIKIALDLESSENNLSFKQIKDVLNQARRRKIFSELTEEELKDSYRDRQLSEKDQIRRVKAWLKVAEMAKSANIKPNGRVGWKELIREYRPASMKPKHSIDRLREKLGLSRVILPYVRMGMSSREIEAVLNKLYQLTYSFEEIRDTIVKGRTKEIFSKLTEEETSDILSDGHATKEEIGMRVDAWLRAIEVAKEKHIHPQGRFGWKKFIAEYEPEAVVRVSRKGSSLRFKVLKPFVEAGMVATEAHMAIEMKFPGLKLSYDQVHKTINKGKGMGVFPKLSKEDNSSAHSDIQKPEEELRRMVGDWCRVMDIMGILNVKPQGRKKWKEAILRYQAIKKFSDADVEDELGRLFVLRNGKTYHLTTHDEEGNMINDTFELAKSRWESRQRNGSGDNGKKVVNHAKLWEL